MTQFNTLLPELFPIIVEHIPAHETPSTLRSLSLTNHTLHKIVHPLLYRCLILKNDHDASIVFQRIYIDQNLGNYVRELHLMSDIFCDDPDKKTPFDNVTALLVAGLLPYIHTLTLYYAPRKRLLGYLRKEFWMALQSTCSRLRRLDVVGLRGHEDGPGVMDFQVFGSLESLSLNLNQLIADPVVDDLESRNFFRSLPTLVLRTLVLCHNFWENISSLMMLDFPHLRSLTLNLVHAIDISETMSFWRRHPNLERVELGGIAILRWFSSGIEPGFLPKLKHLRAPYEDVLALAPMLHQLVTLSIYGTINDQVPFLLCSILPAGLPGLQGLEIRVSFLTVLEEATPYETVDEAFDDAINFQKTHYMNSIARGAPNLKELSLHGYGLKPWLPALAELVHLERFYCDYHGSQGPSIVQLVREAFAASRVLRKKCKRLMVISDTSAPNFPYKTAKVQRNKRGRFKGIMAGEGYGMQIGREDDPFPQNPGTF